MISNNLDPIIATVSQFSFLRGKALESLPRLLRPEPALVRQLLLDIRNKYQIQQALIGAVMGVSKSAICKWESGERNPSGPASRMIVLLHASLAEDDGSTN